MPLIEAVRFRRQDNHPKGAAWLVSDDSLLARGVAQIAIGQWEHLESILQGSRWVDPPVGYSLAGAIKTLSAPPGSPDWLVWHRDGWVFQAISWIAAVETGRGPARPPHIGHAEKGFDGMQLLLTKTGRRAKRLLIFEDKATENPRDKIRDEVWPALQLLEAGERDQELRAELSALLLQAPHLDKVQAVDRVLNQTNNRSYRVAITVGSSHASKAGIQRLFKGFVDVVPGSRFRRRAHVIQKDDLRGWLADIAQDAIAHIEPLR